MSCNKKNSKNNTKSPKSTTNLLTNNNSKQKKFILIGLILSCIAFVTIFGFIMPSINQTTNNPEENTVENNKTTQNEIISIDIINHSLVSDVQFNFWFDISAELSDAVITFIPRNGLVMKYNNETEETELVETINASEVGLYSFVWVFDNPDNETHRILTDLTVEIENNTTKKTTGIYILHENQQILYLNKDQYNVLRKAEDSLQE